MSVTGSEIASGHAFDHQGAQADFEAKPRKWTERKTLLSVIGLSSLQFGIIIYAAIRNL